MIIKLFTNKSDAKEATKTLEELGQIEGTLKNACSIIDPVIVIKNRPDFSKLNYIYIEEFGRYYFVNDITILNNNQIQLACHCDILSTSINYWLKLDAIVSRQEFKFNLEINDPNITTRQNNSIQYLVLPNSFNTYTLTIPILAN